MKLADYYRSGDVYRWQIVKTARQQSVAEHSFHVAILATRLYDRLMETMDIGYYGESWERVHERNLVMQWALFHDMPEVLTGDVATPFKLAIRKAGVDPFSVVEGLVSDEYKKLKEQVDHSELVQRVVKIADTLESIKFLSQNAVTAHGHSVRLSIEKRLNEYVEQTERKAGLTTLKWHMIVREVWDGLFAVETTLDDVLDSKKPEPEVDDAQKKVRMPDPDGSIKCDMCFDTVQTTMTVDEKDPYTVMFMGVCACGREYASPYVKTSIAHKHGDLL